MCSSDLWSGSDTSTHDWALEKDICLYLNERGVLEINPTAGNSYHHSQGEPDSFAEELVVSTRKKLMYL